MERGEKMATKLNEIVNEYLEANGIKISFFADCIDRNISIVSKWLKGEINLRPRDIEKVHHFLNGEYQKSVSDIMNRE